MTRTEITAINRAIALLHSLTGEPHESVPLPRSCSVTRFVREYLAPDPAADVSCGELWTFYREISDAGELPPMRKTIFLRRLPVVMQEIYAARKSHGIQREGRRVRGFKGVGIRMDT
jgi:hypothetical protein